LNPTLLIIDDEKDIRTALEYLFRSKGYDVYSAGTAALGEAMTSELQPDLVILDNKLPDRTGMEALSRIRVAQQDTLVIMLTAFASIKGAVEAIRAGAFDYLTKPVDIEALEISAERAVEMQMLKKENRLLRKLGSEGFEQGIIGSSPQVHKLELMINLLAENPGTTVLIEGESGCGKEVVARTIHRLSSRHERPFVAINCASLSANLLESELFGHERGAFTDAKASKRGLMEVADGGTLFLDEIGELSQELQPKLLRVLETKTFRRVGGTRDIKSDVRFVAATNRDLAGAVGKKEFREDLYYRLRVMPLLMPPLRERGRDILMLAAHFISASDAMVKKKIAGLSPECNEYLLAYPWPGNVRELKNVIERAVILCPGPVITPEYLPRELTGGITEQPAGKEALLTIEELEKKHVLRAMEETSGNQSLAARMLGVSRSTLISKLKKYGRL